MKLFFAFAFAFLFAAALGQTTTSEPDTCMASANFMLQKFQQETLSNVRELRVLRKIQKLARTLSGDVKANNTAKANKKIAAIRSALEDIQRSHSEVRAYILFCQLRFICMS